MNFELSNKKRIVIKVGSALLVEGGSVKDSWLNSLAQDIQYLKKFALEIVIVSSGAIALGQHYIQTKHTQSQLTLPEKQAAAAVGQISLMSAYKTYFAKYDINISQILLTGSEVNNRDRYLNARNSFDSLLKNNIVPIVNENDSVATKEIKIGDNDRLAARTAQIISADLLILLSDIDGLYDKNPTIYKDAKFVPLIEKITKQVENMASDSSSDCGVGGMVTKIQAAKMAFNSGCDTVITQGLINNPLKKLLSGGKYTLFKSNAKKISSRKQWIVDSLNPKGVVIINQRAGEALLKGSSLLPIGVERVEGNFTKGDQVLVKDNQNNHIATGLIAYSYKVAKLIIGKNSNEIKKILKEPQNNKEELIHRNNLVVF